jgi:hypothetical protein
MFLIATPAGEPVYVRHGFKSLGGLGEPYKGIEIAGSYMVKVRN